MLLTAELIASVTDSKVGPNIESLLAGLRQAGTQKGLNLPHRLFQFLAQTAHESQGFRYDREVWRPTAAQLKYEGRKDLGNTQPGDGIGSVAVVPFKSPVATTSPNSANGLGVSIHWPRTLSITPT